MHLDSHVSVVQHSPGLTFPPSFPSAPLSWAQSKAFIQNRLLSSLRMRTEQILEVVVIAGDVDFLVNLLFPVAGQES